MEEDKEELAALIIRKEDELRELKVLLNKKKRFKHVCPHCKREWEGTKEIITQCTFCHERIKMVEVEELSEPKGIGTLKENAARFDAYLREHGSCTKIDKRFGRRGRKTVFTAKGEGFEYARYEDDVEEFRRTMKSTEEVLEEFVWWEWLKGVTLPAE